MGQQSLQPAESAASSTTSTVATDAEPPRASLLGVPKELLNYIITLAVVGETDLGPRTLLTKRFREKRLAPPPKICVLTPPALGRTCTTLEAIVLPIYYGQNTFSFRSTEQAFRWLSRERRKCSKTSVRRIRMYFEGVDGIGRRTRRGFKHAALEVFLEDKTDMLAVSAEDPFYVGACKHCRGRLLEAIEGINGRGVDCTEGKFTALTCYLKGSPECPSRVSRYVYWCTMCSGLDD